MLFKRWWWPTESSRSHFPTLPASQTDSPHLIQFMEHYVFVLSKRYF